MDLEKKGEYVTVDLDGYKRPNKACYKFRFSRYVKSAYWRKSSTKGVHVIFFFRKGSVTKILKKGWSLIDLRENLGADLVEKVSHNSPPKLPVSF